MAKTKKNAFNFQAACEEMLRLAGAEATESDYYPFLLETIAGPLRCAPDEDSLMCRFTDVERAKQSIGSGTLNQFSGKWNWHYTHPTATDLIDLQIARVTELDGEAKDIVGQCQEAALEFQNAPIDTMLRYQYRDGSNYKVGKDICFHGQPPGPDVLKALVLAMNNSNDHPSFIPGLVGLPDLQNSFAGCDNQWDPDRDHPWHELLSISPVPAGSGESYDEGTFADFVRRVQTRGLIDKWDEAYVPDFHAEMVARYEQAQAESDSQSA